MRFLQKSKVNKTVLVISDLHLGAGMMVNDRRNYLEDFVSDRELVDFLEYFSSNDFAYRDVELVINGDLLDFLAVPYINYFDDEFWSEKAALEKLEMIMSAHQEVMEAFNKFISGKRKRITYIIGNHDAELIFESVRNRFLEIFEEKHRDHFTFMLDPSGEYSPVKGVVIKHGHEYEVAHHFHLQESLIEDEEGKKFFLPPWGSYYVTRVINKFKEERGHVNAVRPVRKFIINGLIYDTFFTMRFLVSTIIYFVMVRIIYMFKQEGGFRELFHHVGRELELFQDYESLTREFFREREDIHCLLVGHTHEPSIRTYADGNTFINTGTWTRMYNLDFGKQQDGVLLTYAQVDVCEQKGKDDSAGEKGKVSTIADTSLYVWRGRNEDPYTEFS